MWIYWFIWPKSGTLGTCLGEKRPEKRRNATEFGFACMAVLLLMLINLAVIRQCADRSTSQVAVVQYTLSLRCREMELACVVCVCAVISCSYCSYVRACACAGIP